MLIMFASGFCASFAASFSCEYKIDVVASSIKSTILFYNLSATVCDLIN